MSEYFYYVIFTKCQGIYKTGSYLQSFWDIVENFISLFSQHIHNDQHLKFLSKSNNLIFLSKTFSVVAK